MRTLWRGFKLVLPHRGMLALYIFSAFGLGVFSGSWLVLAKSFFDHLSGVDLHTEKADKIGSYLHRVLASVFGEGSHYLMGLCAVFLLMLILDGVFDYINTYVGSWLAQRLRMEAMNRMMGKLLTLDHPYFDKQNTGDLVARMVSDGENMRKSVKLFLDFLQQPFMVIALVSLAI